MSSSSALLHRAKYRWSWWWNTQLRAYYVSWASCWSYWSWCPIWPLNKIKQKQLEWLMHFVHLSTHSLSKAGSTEVFFSHSVQHSFHYFFIHHRKAVPTSAFNQPPKPEIVRYLSMVLALPSENRGQIWKSQPSDKNNSEEQKLWEQFEAVEALPLRGRQTPGATSQCRQRKKSAKVKEKKISRGTSHFALLWQAHLYFAHFLCL